MQNTTSVTWLTVGAWVITIGNQIIPVLPPLWSAVLASIITIVTILVHGQQVKVGRVGKLR